MENPFGLGAVESEQDIRTIKHEDYTTTDMPLVSGGIDYLPTDIQHQHKVGICTAISLTQNRAKANGKRYSADFQYLLQKKYLDGNWTEGSSIFNALKVGKKYGFLPEYLWTHTIEQDRFLSYEQYIAKLKAIDEGEINRLIALCVDKIDGYASVDVSDTQKLAKAILDSNAGILCRYGCGQTWWTNKDGGISWQPKDINPLRKPVPYTSGHAINMSKFDYTEKPMQVLANSWGVEWCNYGNADINWSNYAPTEAWSILNFTPVIPFKFTKTLRFGMKNDDVKQLQKILGVIQTGYFFLLTEKAVRSFQQKNGLQVDGIVGKYTIAKLNENL